MRTEFGAERTTCACQDCRNNCKVMPGFLIPSDLDRLIPAGADPFKWAEKNLLASPGAIVMRAGELFRIPTLVPATKADGSCIHLQPDESCGIHADAPFGCSFFDCTMTSGSAHADVLSQRGMLAIAAEWHGRGLYFQLWAHLAFLGLEQDGPEVKRPKLDQLTKRVAV